MDMWIDDIVLKPTTPQTRRTIQDYKSSLNFGGNGTPSRLTTAIVASATGLSGLTTSLSAGGWYLLKSTSLTTFPPLMGLFGGNGSATGVNFFTAFSEGLTVKSRVSGVTYNTSLLRQKIIRDEWHHFAFTFDGTTTRGFIDGALVSSATTSGTIDTTNSEIRIGGATGTTYYEGNISNAFVGSYMTDAQIYNIYSNGLYPSGMVGIWPLDEGAGTVARDISGNGNNATISLGVWSSDTPFKARVKATNRTTVT